MIHVPIVLTRKLPGLVLPVLIDTIVIPGAVDLPICGSGKVANLHQVCGRTRRQMQLPMR
jgi:hypothetical protein